MTGRPSEPVGKHEAPVAMKRLLADALITARLRLLQRLLALAAVTALLSPNRLCAFCGHPRGAHEHLRRGTDCSWCARCPRFRRRRRWAPWRRRPVQGDRLPRRQPWPIRERADDMTRAEELAFERIVAGPGWPSWRPGPAGGDHGG